MRLSAFACLVGALLLAGAPPSLAQALWTDVPAGSLEATPDVVATPSRTVRLNLGQMRHRLAAPLGRTGPSLTVPLPDGGAVEVAVTEASILAPSLQMAYPEIRTFLADGAGSVHGRLSLTPDGFRAMLFTARGTVFVDPRSRGDAEHYVVYYGRDQVVEPAQRGRTADTVLGDAPPSGRQPRSAERAHGETLRTYRLAVAVTGEYTAFHGGTVAAGLAAVATTVNRMTAIYERDIAVSFELVADNDLLIYTDASTDPYTNSTAALDQNQPNLDAVIGSANYDVGHVFTTSGGGVAYGAVVCKANLKARGMTGLSSPVGDAFDVDYFSHELGHQFSASHTFNGDSGGCTGGNRFGPTAYEPGSGSTIIAYAGLCGNDDLQSNSDAYFHGASLDQMVEHVTTGSGGTCGTATPTGNGAPRVTVPGPFTIPAGTPFSLTGRAADDARDGVTFAWEEFDLGPQADIDAGTVPLFRSFLPTAEPTRFFPQLDRLVAGLPPVVGETLPPDDEVLTFRLTARDNHPGGGAIGDATTTVAVVDTGAPFAVTFATRPGLAFGSSATVTWDVAGTDRGAIQTPSVDILFSDNGGASFDHVLARATPNDGSQRVRFPVTTAQGRLLIRGSGNVFFNVNPEPFATASARLAGPADLGAATASGVAGAPELALAVPSPNPTGDRARVAFSLAEAGPARLSVVDALGREVAVLAEGGFGAGAHEATFDTARLPAGVYAIRLDAGGQVLVQNATVAR